MLLEPVDRVHDSISSFSSATSRAHSPIMEPDEDIVMPSQSSSETVAKPSPTMMEGFSKDTVIDAATPARPAIYIEQRLLEDTHQETEVQSIRAQPEYQTQAETEAQTRERDPTILCDCGSKVTSR